MVVQNGADRERVFALCWMEYLVEREIQGAGDLVGAGGADLIAAGYAVWHINRNIGLLGKLPLGHATAFKQCFEIYGALVSRIFSHTGFRKVIVELHEVMRLQFVKPDMTNGGIDARHQYVITSNRGWPELLFGIVLEPSLGKVGELDIAVQHLAGTASLLE